jgi:AraC-like DNA-binding protein
VITPVGYLQTSRAEVATRLLESCHATLDALSERVGYGDPSTFLHFDERRIVSIKSVCHISLNKRTIGRARRRRRKVLRAARNTPTVPRQTISCWPDQEWSYIECQSAADTGRTGAPEPDALSDTPPKLAAAVPFCAVTRASSAWILFG